MVYKVVDKYTWKELKDKIVILDLNDGSYFTLNETASFIWRKIVEGSSMNEIADAMQSLFDCSEAEALGDIEGYINECLQEGIIIAVEDKPHQT